MKNTILYLLLILPFLCSCQPKFNFPPYNEFEEEIRKLPQETNKIIIPEDWQKMDSLSFLKFKNVEHIIISGDSIPNWTIRFKNIKTIYTHYGKIKYLPENIGDLSSLERVTIFSHKLENIPISFCKLKKIEYLSFWANELYKIPDCILQFENLEELNLSDNNLTYLPSSINLQKIEKINLEGNQITEIPESIYNL